MSDGTSLEDIETGNIQHSADDSYMNAILSDMNAVEEPIAQQAPVYIPPPMPPQPPMQQPPQQYPSDFPFQMQQMQQMQQPYMQQGQQQQYMQQQQEPSYERVEEPEARLKKNSWYNLFEEMRDPLIVGLLVCLFSLPALHTWLAKYATWAYKVGGSLSWLGFLIQFAIVAGMFATYRQIMQVMGV